MLRNYLIIAIRNLVKQKTFTLINVFGLAVGVACCMILGLYMHHEWSYDRHYPNAENIYRVVRENIDEAGNRVVISETSGALIHLLRNDIPGIRNSVRLINPHFTSSKIWIGTDTHEFKQRLCRAEPEILDIFDLHLVRGNRQTALTTPNGLLVTESVAQKYFGEKDPIGKPVWIEHGGQENYIITGVLKELPKTSMLQFDFLTSNVTGAYRRMWDQWRIGFGWMPIETYVVLETTAKPEDIEHQLLSLVPKYAGDDVRGKVRYHLQPIVRAHLFAKQDFPFSRPTHLNYKKGDIRHLYMAAILGSFILLLAGINFVNLSTARSTMRAKEVGMRKVVGAHRRQIINQFLGESILLSAFAHLFAMLIIQLSLPWVSSLVGITLSLKQAGLGLLLILPASILLIGLLAGSCPAFFISKFKPIAALKSVFTKTTGKTSLRQGLVLFQFSVAVLLIAGTFVVFRQWQFMVEKDLGYNKENVVILPLFKADESLKSRRREIVQRFLNHPNVLYACVTNGLPPSHGAYDAVRPEGETGDWHMYMRDLDEGVLDVFGIELIQGRDFSDDTQHDRWSRYILNESAVKALGWKDPIGKTFKHMSRNQTGYVIGVVKDFHFSTLHQEIKPLYMRLSGGMYYLSLRINSKDLTETIDFFQKTWTDLTNRPFEYHFLDELLENDYRTDKKAGQMFFTAAALAILIACLGLVGLASFSTQQRTKEIGIRKVLGATLPHLVTRFTRDFIKLVALANLLMIPVSIYVTQMWLDQFAYRIEPGPYPYAFSAILSLLIAATTVCIIAFRAAAKNPVDALRSE